jgi:hypothetical protein
MDGTMFQVFSWVLGGLGTLLIFLFGFWWKIEHKQDEKIDALYLRQEIQHRDLHDKIESQHHAVRDRLDNIWKHISS